MEPKTIAQGVAAGRVAFGVAMLAVPGRIASSWVGPRADNPSGHVIVRGFGARDVALGVGALAALQRGEGVRPWLIAATAGDLSDMVATAVGGRELPRNGLIGTAVLAGAAAGVGAWLSAQDW